MKGVTPPLQVFGFRPITPNMFCSSMVGLLDQRFTSSTKCLVSLIRATLERKNVMCLTHYWHSSFMVRGGLHFLRIKKKTGAVPYHVLILYYYHYQMVSSPVGPPSDTNLRFLFDVFQYWEAGLLNVCLCMCVCACVRACLRVHVCVCVVGYERVCQR